MYQGKKKEKDFHFSPVIALDVILSCVAYSGNFIYQVVTNEREITGNICFLNLLDQYLKIHHMTW